ncbi:MAG: hypothetical protein ACREJ2_17360, partial [Planctomycetota bacterium]
IVYCGTIVEWMQDAGNDHLIRGMVRVPLSELYSESKQQLEPTQVILDRVQSIGLKPEGRYVLTGATAADIAAVYMALDQAGFKHLSVFFP